MRLTSNPKPVRFRIKSGGEEHSSLDSLRHNFCLSDLQQVEKQFIQWLKRQGEEGLAIAEELQIMPTKLSNCASLDDFLMVYKILFKDTIPLSYFDSLVKLHEWFSKNPNRYSKNLVSLHEILWGVEENYTISVIENEKRFTEETVDILNRFNSARAHFLLSRYYLEVKKDFCRGEKLLTQAKAEGCEKAKAYIVDKKVKEYFNKWPDIDIEYMKAHIESLINKQEYNYPHEWTENEKKLHKFITDCLQIGTFSFYAYRAALERFGTKRNKRSNKYITKDDFLYEQKLFVIHIVELEVDESDAINGLAKQSESFYPAKYLVDKSETNPLLDSVNFRRKGYANKIKILLQNIFEF